MHQTLLEIINHVLANNRLQTIEVLSPGARLREDLGMDSINLAELSVRLEDAFGVDVFDQGMISTLGELITKLNTQSNS